MFKKIVISANEIEKAKDTDRKVIACAIAGAVLFGVLLIICSPFLPNMEQAHPLHFESQE